MQEYEQSKIIIVEGRTDEEQVRHVMIDDVQIICTHGTFNIERFDHLVEAYQLDDRKVYLLLDIDESGLKLRKQLRQELPHAQDIHVPEEVGEVASTPLDILASVLKHEHIDVNTVFLIKRSRGFCEGNNNRTIRKRRLYTLYSYTVLWNMSSGKNDVNA